MALEIIILVMVAVLVLLFIIYVISNMEGITDLQKIRYINSCNKLILFLIVGLIILGLSVVVINLFNKIVLWF